MTQLSESAILLSTAYAAPLEWFSRFAAAGKVYLEQYENFIKQTYRNRCVILGANGPLTLVIPVEHGRSPRTPIREIRIAGYDPWQRNHWRALFSAYNNSPFFEYYADDFRPFYEKRFRYLFDFNQELHGVIAEASGIEKEITPTVAFEQVPVPFDNWRERITPKRKGGEFWVNVSYTQVFDEKYSFVPNLSIYDLLFNVGPGARDLLLQMGMQA